MLQQVTCGGLLEHSLAVAESYELRNMILLVFLLHRMYALLIGWGTELLRHYQVVLLWGNWGLSFTAHWMMEGRFADDRFS